MLDMDRKTFNLICDIEEELNRMKKQEMLICCKYMGEDKDAGLDYRIDCDGSNINYNRRSFEK